MGLDAVVTFASFEDMPDPFYYRNLNDLAYDLSRWVGPSEFIEHPCIEHRDYSGRFHVRLWSRYYGPGYERGSWPVLRAILAFLDPRTIDLRYGGDSSDWQYHVAASAAITQNDQHFLAEGYPYRWDEWSPHEKLPDGCEVPIDAYGKKMKRHGWGTGYAAFWSPGTGEHRVFKNGEWTEGDT